MERLGTRRIDNVNIFDVRAEKVLPLARTRLRVLADLFNLRNSHAVEIQSWATGTSFLRPTNVIAPRVMRVGFRFEW